MAESLLATAPRFVATLYRTALVTWLGAVAVLLLAVLLQAVGAPPAA
ncbi:MAG TPA: hypothetical protein VM681_03930 [Candidatus Thermoplasmatota archaeon]|nr:hypothetical protein [Candidatus Thermoplasmatota archaeon]